MTWRPRHWGSCWDPRCARRAVYQDEFGWWWCWLHALREIFS